MEFGKNEFVSFNSEIIPLLQLLLLLLVVVGDELLSGRSNTRVGDESNTSSSSSSIVLPSWRKEVVYGVVYDSTLPSRLSLGWCWWWWWWWGSDWCCSCFFCCSMNCSLMWVSVGDSTWRMEGMLKLMEALRFKRYMSGRVSSGRGEAHRVLEYQ